jgi:hypothetical protein
MVVVHHHRRYHVAISFDCTRKSKEESLDSLPTSIHRLDGVDVI